MKKLLFILICILAGVQTTKAQEAYACYTSSNATLTFYYDNLRSTRTGTTYNLNTGENDIGWEKAGVNVDVTQVVFDSSFANARPATTCGWFFNMQKLQSITGMQYLNTCEVTNMAWMFKYCELLTSIDVSHFNTAKVTNMRCMFYGCSGLTSLDLSSFNTAKVTDMTQMFQSCSGLTSLDLSSFNTAHVTEMSSMFCGCSSLTIIYVGDGWSTAAVTGSNNMFSFCDNLVGGKGTKQNESDVSKEYARIDGGESNPGYLTQVGEAYAVYTSSNSTLTFYYDLLRNTRTGTTYSLNTDGTDTGWETAGVNATVTQVVFDSSFANARPTTTYSWFYGMQQVQSITGMEYLNTSEVTSMSWMFGRCAALNSLDLSHFNTAKVTNMSLMFNNCSSLTMLDLSSFNTAKVTNMQQMFYGCSNLTTIYVGDGWNTDAVSSANSMFEGCTSLVGGSGTKYNSYQVGKGYAHIDGGESNPGYLSPEREVYAAYNADNATLTFYYDHLRSTRPGPTYNLNIGGKEPGWMRQSESITSVVFDPTFAVVRPKTTYRWFCLRQDLQSITGMEYLNTSEVTNMYEMFNLCSGLTSLDVSHFNTANVTNMQSMFSSCSSLTSLDLSSFNTANVTSMTGMFDGCSGLTSLDLSSFNTANVNYMNSMFSNCRALTIIYVGDGWSTAAVTGSDNMFSSCTKLVGGKGTTYDEDHVSKEYARIDGGESNPGYLTQVGEAYAVYTSSYSTLTFYYDLLRNTRTGTTYSLNTDGTDTGWETDGVNATVTQVVFDSSFANARPTTTYSWFYDMQQLQSITGMEYLNTSEVTSMSWMFGRCFALNSLDMSHFNTAKVTNMRCMFNNCSSLTLLDLSSFNTAKVNNMQSMFYGCSNLTTIYVGDGWNTDAVSSANSMFLGCTKLVGGNGTTYDASHVDAAYARIDGGESNPGYLSPEREAYAVYNADNATLTFYYDILRSTRSGTTYDLNTGVNTPGWYTNRTNITSVVFDSSFADARPTNCYCWFSEMVNLTSITGMEYLNTSEVTNMEYMFEKCSGLTSLDLSSFNTAKVTSMKEMFYNCSGLIRLDLSSFNTAKVTSMNDMFYYCSGLTRLDLSSFNTAKVNTMYGMFYNCSGLTRLDLSSFNTAKVTSMMYMFAYCSRLTTIYVGDDWSTDAVTYSSKTFYHCYKLVGGKGTKYNESYVNAAYAHIDGGQSNPGYFTEKPSFIPGDANGDRAVSVADAVAVVAYLLNPSAANINLDAADVDGVEGVTIGDVQTIVNMILNKTE